jgi:MerR family copper efflux transcriptional regulator
VKLSEKIVEIEWQIKRLQILKLELEGLLESKQQIPKTLEETICPILEQIQAIYSKGDRQFSKLLQLN